ncbi:transglutaminase domain-containing protein [Clostridium niameyense]|uniref:Transglutaminase domain-containing protein n=1 Tax=Clostridium niameyense TaxID=1622073 RepID=A0A6M0RBK5_9CLOT|nr:transglutaminase domain-containing protein [Clostridium niameyense]NEZ47603.1 transglutaminase domain-containing protein [Clostridium niameyense]
MKYNPINLILLLVFLFPILKGFLYKFSSRDLKSDIEETNKTIAFILSLFLGVYYGRKIFMDHSSGLYKEIYIKIPDNIIRYIDNNQFIIYIVIIPLLTFIVYKIIEIILHAINSVTIYILLDKLEKLLQSTSSLFKRILGAIFNLPKSICYVLLVTFTLNIFSMFVKNNNFNRYLEMSKPYKSICKQIIIPITNSKIARKLPNIIDNSFKIQIKEIQPKNTGKNSTSKTHGSKTIVYYNGVTLDEGVKSNKTIDTFARGLAAKEASSKEKSKIIYNWVGKNIAYDHNKASRVLNDDFDVKSGAIATFQTRKGICFDYACLYVAMCKANDIKVRLVTGEGFNGVSWVSHAWNQVYVPEEGRWVNVDATFYNGGNYFDTKRFEIDHRKAEIIGEW